MIFKYSGSFKLKNLQLKTKLIITYLLITVIPMALIGIVIYYQNTKAMEEEVGEYIPRLLKQANQNIENEVKDLENLPNLIYNSSDVMAVLRTSPYKDKTALLQDQFTVESFLSSTFLGRKNSDILGAFLLSKNRSFVSTKIPYQGFNLTVNAFPYGEMHEWDEGIDVILPNRIDLTFEGEQPYILLAKDIKDLDNRESLGTLFLAVEVSFMEEVLQDLDEEENATMWVMDNQGQVIYHTDPTRIGTRMKEIDDYPILNGSFSTIENSERTLISVNQSAQHPWVIVHSIPLKYLTERSDTVRTITIILFVILVVVTTIISIYLARTVTKPISILSDRMKEVEKGQLDVDIPIHAKDEVGELANSFQSMIHEIRDLIKQNYHIEIRQKNAELYALQSQINPHFMYNTLETIGAAIEEDEKELVVDMVAILGDMLRFSLSNKHRIVSIAEEVNHINNYLILHKFRFVDRISFDIQTEVDQHTLFTPKFILQPIVENTVKYGMQYKRTLKIDITIMREVDSYGYEYVVFRIRDNGPGITKGKLAEIKRKLQLDPMIERESGFGITNVHGRIVMMFGNHYGISVNSTVGEGTEVKLRIPLITKSDVERMTKGGSKDE